MTSATAVTGATAAAVTRTILLWCPDWPITAAAQAKGISPVERIAVIDRGDVFACSAAARAEGVRRGMRLREAQSHCPDLIVYPYDSALDHRAFEPVVDAVEEIASDVQIVRPGVCALRARGLARFYGDEDEAALWLLDTLDELGIRNARIGIADGPFAAEQAAKQPRRSRITRVAEAGSGAFLAPLPVNALGNPELVRLLGRLGIRTLGDFAALSLDDVRSRFGPEGGRLHLLAAGLDTSAVTPRLPPQQLQRSLDFEPALTRIDQITFTFRQSADAFITTLAAAGLVCTALRVGVRTESGDHAEREWLHPRHFTASDVLDRVRWQLEGSGLGTGASEGSGGGSGSGAPGTGAPAVAVPVSAVSTPLRSAIVGITVEAAAVDAASHHEPGLWGTQNDHRVHHSLSRVQGLLGHDAVLTTVLGGGRSPAERQTLVAWGDRPLSPRRRAEPWPGQLPTPPPSTVFAQPRAAQVHDAAGAPVTVDANGVPTAAPARFRHADQDRDIPISQWAGPWPLDEHWWDPARHRRIDRFQIVDNEGTAWLLVLEDRHWWVEARYD